jgi:dolichol-phosphate mannosyltransferase
MAALWYSRDGLQPPDHMDLSVVIPVFNEAENIEALFVEVKQALTGRFAFEVVFIDDGSKDATVERLTTLSATHPELRIVRHAVNCGQSAATLSGVRAARAAWIATLDGDGQNDPKDIPALFERARQGASQQPPIAMIAGHRTRRKDTWRKRMASRIANAIRARLLHDGTPDTGCGLKVFRRDVFLELPYFDHIHRFLPALVRRAGYGVESMSVSHRPRRAGTSKYGVIDRLLVGIPDLLGVMWLNRRARRPMIAGER